MTKTAKELQEEGLLYDVFDEELASIKDKTYGLVNELSHVDALDKTTVLSLVNKIVGKFGTESYIVPPFRCDYGPNITIGEHCFINYNCCFLDSAKVTIGDYVYMGPNCNIFTPCHPIHHELRWDKVTEYALPVTVGSHTWIAGDVIINPGVTIGEGCVIGAGSVVTKDIPDNSLAVGNPCKVIRQLNEDDKKIVEQLTLNDDTKDNVYKQEHGYMYFVMDKALRSQVENTVHYVNILNKLSNSEIQRRRDFLRIFTKKFDEGAIINSPFYMEFGNHLEVGINSIIEGDCIMLNSGHIKIGDNVLIGPKTSFYTPVHPFLPEQRETWIEYAKPITIEDNVWICGSVTITGGITIGENSIICPGSVITHDVPSNTIVAGNPAKVIRKITEEDIAQYKQELAKEQNTTLSEKDKMEQGYWYNTFDTELIKLRQQNAPKTEAYSRISANTLCYKDKMAKAIINNFGENANIIPPFTCTYGNNVSIGEATIINHNGVFIDSNKINVGAHALIGPKSLLNCSFRPYDIDDRNNGIAKTSAINIGDGAWLGGRVTVLPGITIGKHSVIGSGSVVTENIPDDVVAVGNPCRVIRKITEKDKLNPYKNKKS